MLEVVCVKWGTLYGPEYVNILHRAISKMLPIEHRFTCFTDDQTGLDDGINVRSLPGNLEGWWNKLWLFKKGVLSGRVLYIDLDTVIVRNIAEIAEYSGEFAILRDFYRPDGYGSGVMAWEADKLWHIWESFEAAGYPKVDGGDQAWIERVQPTADRWQDLFPGQFVSYKQSCRDGVPLTARIVCFHGNPRPHHLSSEWVEKVWKDGLSLADYVSKANVENATVRAHVERNAKRKTIPWVYVEPMKRVPLIVVAGGPSLEDTWQDIAERKKKGGYILAMNGAGEFLRSKGITPDGVCILDARPENIRFVENAHRDCEWLIASQCHPSLFKALDGCKVRMWHCDQDGVGDILKPIPKPLVLIGGGGTVGMRALNLGYAMGYREFHLYGFDSSYRDGEGHAYAQSLNDGERRVFVHVGDKSFTAAPWMARQAQDFQIQARVLSSQGCRFGVHGDGLIPYVFEQMKHLGAVATA